MAHSIQENIETKEATPNQLTKLGNHRCFQHFRGKYNHLLDLKNVCLLSWMFFAVDVHFIHRLLIFGFTVSFE